MGAVLLTRIDERLVHGQVALTWMSSLSANLILVVDEAAAKDEMAQKIMRMVADSYGFGIRFFSIEECVEKLPKASPSQKIFMVVKTPAVAKALVEAGVDIAKLNVGNMHFAQGREQLSAKAFASKEELLDLRAIEGKGFEVFIQDLPGDMKKSLPKGE